MAERDNSKNSNPMAIMGTPEGAPLNVEQRARKRGRPPLTLASSSSSPRGRARGRPPSAILRTLASTLGGGNTPQTAAGASFAPHVLDVNTGEDVGNKILEFAKNCCQTVCVLSAVGTISSVILGKPGSSSDTLKCEGRFVIMSLTGSYTFFPGDDSARGKNGTLNISLAESDGNVFGGTIMGPTIAADPVNLVLASFKVNISKEVMRRHTAGSSSVANLSSNLEIDLEKVPPEEPMVEGKQTCPSPTSGLLPTTDKPSESVTPATTDKPSDNVTPATTDKPPENVTAATTDKPPENVTTATTENPSANVTAETTDKPSGNVTAATTDKPSGNVTPATTDKPPKIVCVVNEVSEDIPENLYLGSDK